MSDKESMKKVNSSAFNLINYRIKYKLMKVSFTLKVPLMS